MYAHTAEVGALLLSAYMNTRSKAHVRKNSGWSARSGSMNSVNRYESFEVTSKYCKQVALEKEVQKLNKELRTRRTEPVVDSKTASVKTEASKARDTDPTPLRELSERDSHSEHESSGESVNK